MKPYKPRIQPRLTENQRIARLKFGQERKKWSVNEWQRVIFSDESPFELFHPRNRQNDRIWSDCREKVPHFERVKFPGKLQVWGAMSHRALSELHFMPPCQTVNTEYYIDEILKKTLASAMRRKRVTGNVFEIKMLSDMSEVIFQQDGAPAHTSKKFWEKGIWPANSPDLSPIENLWAILQRRLYSMERPSNLESLQKQLIQAWSEITPEILDKLIASMPSRIRKCIELKGEYIGK